MMFLSGNTIRKLLWCVEVILSGSYGTVFPALEDLTRKRFVEIDFLLAAGSY
jgi:DNA-binding PadR family transcriptional regulator